MKKLLPHVLVFGLVSLTQACGETVNFETQEKIATPAPAPIELKESKESKPETQSRIPKAKLQKKTAPPTIPTKAKIHRLAATKSEPTGSNLPATPISLSLSTKISSSPKSLRVPLAASAPATIFPESKARRVLTSSSRRQ